MKISELISTLATTSSKKEKENILARNKSKTLCDLLVDVYAYKKKYWIKKLPNASYGVGSKTIESDYEYFREHLDKLNNREITGNSAIGLTEEVLNQFTPEDAALLTKVLFRDLGAGFSESTVNKVYTDLIETFDVALAENVYDFDYVLDDETGHIDVSNIKHVTDNDYVISFKLDGLRCIVVKVGNDVKFYSREGNEFETLSNLIPTILEQFAGIDIILDGEVCIMREDGIEDFKAISSEYNRGKVGQKLQVENPKLVVFDILTHEEFFSGVGTVKHTDRLARHNIIENNRISKLEHVPYTKEVFFQMQTQYKQLGREGLMLRRDCGYKKGRSHILLKVKPVNDAEYTIVGYELGTINANVAGVGIVVHNDVVTKLIIHHKGNEVGVGSGLTIYERIEFAKDPSIFMNKEATILYTEISKDKTGKESLRFPRLKKIWFDGKREV